MKIASLTSIALVLAWSILTVLQIWFRVISFDLYIKITVTFLLIGGGIVAACMIAREYTNEKDLKKNKYID